MIDLMAISAMDRDTEMTWVRKERDWLTRAQAEGRAIEPGRLLPMLPSGVRPAGTGGNGHAVAGYLGGNGHAAGDGQASEQHG
jgi:hypothetical protein